MAVLDRKIAVIVGGGRGLGRTIATTLARAGARVVLAARTASELESAAAEVRAAGGEAAPVRTDATREEEVWHLARCTRDTYGEPDILVNCAGEALLKPLAEITWDDWQRILAVNLGSVFLTMREFLPGMMARGRGAIVNLASRAAITGAPAASVYGSAKAGVIAFTRCWTREAAAHGVQLAVIAPGPMDTPMRWAATPAFDRTHVIPPQAVADLVLLAVSTPNLVYDDVLIPVSINY
jgi:3-oxoacyl-[acyl-carrier protein] reductase